MRRLPRWALLLAALPLLLAACEGGEPAELKCGAGRAATTAPPAPGRLFVLRLGDTVEVVKQRSLKRAPRAPRRQIRGWSGRWEVRSGGGLLLDHGRFRIPRRRHALYGDVNGPAGPADEPLESPVVWLRVSVPPSAQTLVLYDQGGRRRLGELAL